MSGGIGIVIDAKFSPFRNTAAVPVDADIAVVSDAGSDLRHSCERIAGIQRIGIQNNIVPVGNAHGPYAGNRIFQGNNHISIAA